MEGRLETRKWTDKEGKDRYTTEVIASDMKMLGSRSGMGGADTGERVSSGNSGSSAAAAPGKSTGARFDDFEDDIPF